VARVEGAQWRSSVLQRAQESVRREEEEARRSERVVRGKTEEVNKRIRETRASWLGRII
jgi:hypothetical protein